MHAPPHPTFVARPIVERCRPTPHTSFLVSGLPTTVISTLAGTTRPTVTKGPPMIRNVWKAPRRLRLPGVVGALVITLGVAACGSGPATGTATAAGVAGGEPADGAGAGAAAEVSANACRQVASAKASPQAATLALVIDRTASELVRGLPPAAESALEQAQAAEWNLAVVSVNGAGADPVVAPMISLDPRPGLESPSADRARTAALACLPAELDSTSLAPTAPGSDILAAVAAAGRQRPDTLLVISDGVASAGGLDLTRIGYDADAPDVAGRLGRAHQLPDLHAVRRTIWTGLGETATPLPQPARAGLERLWSATLTAAGTVPTFDSRVSAVQNPKQVGALTPAGLPDPVPSVSGSTITRGAVVCLTLPSSILFAPESATVGNSDPLRPVAKALSEHTGWAVQVIGHTADYGSRSGQQKLSVRRAQAVLAVLRDLGVPATATRAARGVGSDEPAMPEWHDGVHDQRAAAANRRVVVSYGDAAALTAHTCA